MNEPKFTKGPLTPFRVERKRGRFDIGLEDSERTVLCYTAGGNPDTRMANVTLWSMAGELYDFASFFESFAGQAYLMILPDEAGKKIYEEAVRICKKVRGEE